jgi:hypothetical protein
MRQIFCLLNLSVILLLLSGPFARAQTTQPVADPTARTTTRPATAPAGRDEKSGDHIVVTRHSIAMSGRTLDYTAAAGTMAQKD